MLMSFDNSGLVRKKREMGDQMKAIDGPDTICLYISSESLHYKHFEQNKEHIHVQLHIRMNDVQNIMI